MEKKIKKIFKDNDFDYEYVICDNDCVGVVVIWGDWKHDHARLRYVMEQNGFKCLGEQVTEEDGCDCYSATHVYKLIQK